MDKLIGVMGLGRNKSPLLGIREELRDLPLCKLRQQLQYIGSESFIAFNGTLRMLRPTKRNYTAEEVKNQCQQVVDLTQGQGDLETHTVEVVPFLKTELANTTRKAASFVDKVVELIS